MNMGLLTLLERLGLMKSSTRRFFEESRSLRDAVHGYVYGRFTQTYVNFLLSPRLKPSREGVEWLAEGYHGKILTHEHARSIVVNERVIRKDLEQVIPFPTARDLVLNGPPDIAVYECVCRHARSSPCQPTMVCMVVGQPMVDMVLDHHPGASRRLTREQALGLLEAEHARGHIHAAWFKNAMLGRFYAICNCCKCCCGGIQAMKNSGALLLASSGFVAEIDRHTCSLCGSCVDACPFDALAMRDDFVERNWESCLGCGACEVLCTTGAIHLARDERKGMPLDVRTLS